MGLGKDGTLHGTYESRSCAFSLDRPVSRKTGKTKTKLIVEMGCCKDLESKNNPHPSYLPHSKLGCLFFSTGSSNSSITLHGRGGWGEGLFSLF